MGLDAGQSTNSNEQATYVITLTAASQAALNALVTGAPAAKSFVATFPAEYTITQAAATTCDATGLSGGASTVNCQFKAQNKVAINIGTLQSDTLSFSYKIALVRNPYKAKVNGKVTLQAVSFFN